MVVSFRLVPIAKLFLQTLSSCLQVEGDPLFNLIGVWSFCRPVIKLLLLHQTPSLRVEGPRVEGKKRRPCLVFLFAQTAGGILSRCLFFPARPLKRQYR
jgi:hypothetical protein